MAYIVVFEAGEDSNTPGVRTWTSFRDEESFQAWLKESGNRDSILAEGVTPDQAIKLTELKSAEELARYVVYASSVEGNLDPELALHNFKEVISSPLRQRK